MSEQYEVWLGAESVGQARVSREGLYSRFECRCRLSGEVVCRIAAMYGLQELDLGIAVPENGQFCVDTRIPVKRVPEGIPRFEVRPRRAERDLDFIPVHPEEPFIYLARLKQAYLVKRGETAGVMLRVE